MCVCVEPPVLGTSWDPFTGGGDMLRLVAMIIVTPVAEVARLSYASNKARLTTTSAPMA